MHDKKPKKIKILTDQETQEDLERYRNQAISLGASDAAVIPAGKVHVDSRVRIKCIIPKCAEYACNAHCPPHSPETETIRELVQGFKYALLVKLETDPAVTSGADVGVTEKDGKRVPTKGLVSLLKNYKKLADIVTEIESQAFYDGHYLATAFSAGSCRTYICNWMECQVLKGEACRLPMRARPSMEACSLDAYRMATEAGWDIYPIGIDCDPKNVPHGTLLGLVLVE